MVYIRPDIKAKPVTKGVAVKITGSRRVLVPCPAAYAKALVLALAGKINVDLPYGLASELMGYGNDFPPLLWYSALTSDNSPAIAVFNDKKKLADLLEKEAVEFWKWEPEKAERIRKEFVVSTKAARVIDIDADDLIHAELDGAEE